MCIIKNAEYEGMKDCENTWFLFIPSFNFGPTLYENQFLTTFKKRAFILEPLESLGNSTLYLDVTIKDEDFYWVDNYKL